MPRNITINLCMDVNNKVNEQIRQIIFQYYWNLDHWDLQTKFINAAIALRRDESQTTKKTIPDEAVNLIKEHIYSTFLKFSSRYSRKKNLNRKYLDTNLYFPAKESFYRLIFKTYFHLTFLRPQTDTCSTCDQLQNLLYHEDPEVIKSAMVQKELHLLKAEAAKIANANAVKQAQNDSTTVVVYFDLHKMLPKPPKYFIPGNCGLTIFAFINWLQGMPQCSCGMGDSVLENVKKYRLVSLSSFKICPRNEAYIAFIRNTPIKTVDHKFISRHSFMECDQNFGAVKKVKKWRAN
ncbi:hypothetical protein PR048_005236 [Dryococelus australis]|uniref:Uncharacterized protein n=1 Tax=Dryococelus australis TaxID=614101 RepID=A0ABQ9I7P5_9NEOP|nr:hypothetical protein PR048_005236 [Dryococelus australis]